MDKAISNNKTATRSRFLSLASHTYKLDLVVGLAMIGWGLYDTNYWFIGLGSLSFLLGIYNPHKRLMSFITKIKKRK